MRIILRRLFLFCWAIAATAHAATATFSPSKDTTIYGPASAVFSDLTNGKGENLFIGRSGDQRALRSLITFDLAGQIPPGATITAVTLTLPINTPHTENRSTLRLHRLLADWGEGTVAAGTGGGAGAPATSGSATWRARVFNTAPWTTPGGDFAGTASAAQAVASTSPQISIAAPGLVADVQSWVANPATNFGWIMMAENESDPAVRFGSREATPAPSLVVEFTTAGGGGNSAPTFTTQPASQSVSLGANVTFAVVAAGTPPPALQWRKDGAAILGATGATLALASVTEASAGSYTVVATNAAGSATSAPAQLTIFAAPGTSTARLSNLSVRTAMAAGQTLIVGFAVSGGGNRGLLVRGVGPTLAGFGLTGAMADPRLELYNGTTLVAQNDDWGNSAALSAAFASVGAFPFTAGSRDAALLQTIDGTRSVQLKGTGAGVVLLELYDSGGTDSARLINVSARNQVGTGDNVLICGFVVAGTGAKNLLIRAVGPRLTDFGVTGVLVDPRFEVFRTGATAAVASNDNWDASLAATFASVGAFSLVNGSRDAALVTSLTPGSYTVQVSGVANGTGEALVEIYELP